MTLWTVPTRLLCPWDFPRKNTGVGCHFLFQGIFLTQGSNPSLLCLLHWQVDSLPLSHQGSPTIYEASLIFKVTSENSKMINCLVCLKTFLGPHIFSSNTRNASGTAGQVDHPDVVKSMHSRVCLTSNPALPFNSCRTRLNLSVPHFLFQQN